MQIDGIHLKDSLLNHVNLFSLVMKRIKSIISLTLAACYIVILTAQNGLGLKIGDYNAPYSYSLNPALSFGNPSQRIYINWWGAAVNLENNFMQYNAPFRLGAWTSEDYPKEYQDINGNLSFEQDWLPVNTSKDVFRLNYLSEVYGPSFWVPVGDIGVFGFGMKEVSGFSVNGLNGTFGGILRYGQSHLNKNAGKTINQNEFSINTEKYQEFVFNWAGYAPHDGENVFKWGLSGKILVGMGMAHLGSDNLNFRVSNDAQSIEINQFNGRLYRSATGNLSTLTNPMGMSFDFIEGVGLGMDVGMVYEHRPMGGRDKRWGSAWSKPDGFCKYERRQKYDWKFGVSLTDIGFVNYEGNSTEIVSTSNQSWGVNPNILQSVQNSSNEDRLASIENTLFQSLGAVDQDFFNSINSFTPAALNVQWDQYMGGKLHVGAYWTQNLKRRNSVGLRRASYLSVSPRWQTENFEYGFPVTLANDYTTLHVGAYARFGPVIIGSDNLVGLNEYIQNSKYTGGSFYFGVRSKIGGCDKRTERFTYLQKEMFYDTIREVDTQQVRIVTINRDTIRETKNETVKINDPEAPNAESEIALKELSDKNNQLNDTIAYLKNILNESQRKCAKNEARILALSKKCEDEQERLKAQAEITAKELKNKEDQIDKWKLAYQEALKSSSDDEAKKCQNIILELESQKKDLEEQLNKAQTRYNELKAQSDELRKKCNDEKEAQQLYIDKLTKELAQLKKEKAQITAEKEILKDQVERLTLVSPDKPCDEQVKAIEEELSLEKKRNAEITAESDDLKSKNKNLSDENTALKDKLKKSEITADEIEEKYADVLKDFQREQNKNKICDDQKDSLLTVILNQKKEAERWKSKFEELRKRVALKDCGPLEAENNTLRDKVLDLENKLSEVKKEKSKITAELDNEKASSRKSFTVFEQKLKELNEKIEKLQSELAVSKEELDQCKKNQSKIQASSGNSNVLRDSIDLLKAKNASLNSENDKLAKLLQSCTRAKEEQTEKAKITAAEITKKDAEIKKWKEAYEKSQETQNKSTSDECKQTILELESQKKDLERQLNDAQSRISTLETKINGLIDSCSKQKSAIQSQIDVLKKQLSSKDAEINKWKTAYEESTASSQNNSAQECKAIILELEAQKKTLEQQLIDAQSKAEDFETKLNACKADCDKQTKELQSKIKAIQSELDNCKKSTSSASSNDAKIAQLRDSLTLATSEKRKLSEELNTIQKELNTLKSKITASSQGDDALKNEVNRLNEVLSTKEKSILASEASNKKCNDELAKIKTELEKVKGEKQSVSDDYEALKSQIVTMDADMAKLGEIIKTNNTELSNLRAEIEQLQIQLKDCNAKLKAKESSEKSEEGEGSEESEEPTDPGN